MIAQIHGKLEDINSKAALIKVNESFIYEVLLPTFVVARLGDQIGKPITLHTLHYYESQNQGSSFIPRLAGFLTVQDRAFFELFTTCKGVGNRKALRAMALSTNQIACAIADRDAATLQSLPEIGKRLAETIVVSLTGKVDRYLVADTLDASGSNAQTQASPNAPKSPSSSFAREALEVLMQLGENRLAAIQWIDQAIQHPDGKPKDVQTVIDRVYRLKADA